MRTAGDGSELIPATPQPRVASLFAWYAERLLRRSFHAVRAMPHSLEALRDFGAQAGRGIVLLSHASWWDPIVSAFLWRRGLRGRPVLAPMDRRELERFRFMRRLGLFGIDPDDPRALPAMVEYVRRAASPDAILMLTPQGRFTDPREPLVLRPGAAALAARLGIGQVLAVSIEYAFWSDKRPEVFLRATLMPSPIRPTVAAWQRSMQDCMGANAEALAGAVRSREPERFEQLLGSGASVHPLYDRWLRLRGRSSGIDERHRHPTRLVGRTV